VSTHNFCRRLQGNCVRGGGILPLSSDRRQFAASTTRQRPTMHAGAAMSGAAAGFPQQGSSVAPRPRDSSSERKAADEISVSDHGALHAIDIGMPGVGVSSADHDWLDVRYLTKS
jgi:hypothetical protein